VAPPQLACLDVLVREFGVEVGPGARQLGRDAPPRWLSLVRPEHCERALDALLALGADLEARNDDEHTPTYAGV
jgi:hypothetical protein